MSLFDKVVAAFTPPETAEARAEARRKAQERASPGDWLSQILDHHVAIERGFAAVKAGKDGRARLDALKELGVILTGHANAEESVIYPALADHGEKGHAGTAYEEQAVVKIQMAFLEKLDPMSRDFIDKLEHIEGAVAHHVYAEEGNWFIDLKNRAAGPDQEKLTARYAEEFERYVAQGASGTPRFATV